MPTYTFINNKTQEEFSLFMSMSEKDTYLIDNPDVTQTLLAANPVCDPTRVGISSKPDDGFRDVLRNMKKKHLHSTINTF